MTRYSLTVDFGGTVIDEYEYDDDEGDARLRYLGDDKDTVAQRALEFAKDNLNVEVVEIEEPGR